MQIMKSFEFEYIPPKNESWIDWGSEKDENKSLNDKDKIPENEEKKKRQINPENILTKKELSKSKWFKYNTKTNKFIIDVKYNSYQKHIRFNINEITLLNNILNNILKNNI